MITVKKYKNVVIMDKKMIGTLVLCLKKFNYG